MDVDAKLELQVTTVCSRVFLLVRHGDYAEWEADNSFKVLTPCGRLQAKSTAKCIKRMPGKPTVTRIVSSTQVRAQQTAEIIHLEFPSIEMEVDPLLVEGTPDLQRDCT